MSAMPIVPVVAAVAIVVVLVRTAARTWQCAKGRAGSRAEQLLLLLVSLLVVWQASLWLGAGHEASGALHAGVLLQLVCASVIAILCLVQIVLGRRQRAPGRPGTVAASSTLNG
jgi:hypothetical protein